MFKIYLFISYMCISEIKLSDLKKKFSHYINKEIFVEKLRTGLVLVCNFYATI